MKTHWLKLTVWSIVVSAGFIAVTLLLVAHAVLAAPASTTFNVNSTLDKVDDNTLDGLCHTASNTCTLRAAIMQANQLIGSDVTISLPGGVYVLSIGPSGADDAASGDLNLDPPCCSNPIITIVGAGIGQTIIDGHGTDRIFSIETNRTAIINAVTIRNGHVTGLNQGGAVIVTGTLTINNSKIFSNSAVSDGGGVQNNGTLIINHSIIANNQSSNYGGGIANDIGGQLHLNNSSILNNHANNATGGGIFNYSAVLNGLTISNTTIASNTAYAGGGIGSDWQIDPIRIINSAIYSNTASTNGGGIDLGWLNSGDVHVINSTISYNSANGDGGGIASESTSHIWLYNATIAYNTAGANYSTIGKGGGIASLAGAVFTSQYSIIAWNTDVYTTFILSNLFTFTQDNECYGTFGYEHEDIMYNYDTARCNPPGLIYLGDPLISPLRNNGGSTWTHALWPNSPAIDAGGFCSDDNGNTLTTDQRGFARFVDVLFCDIGAYESGSWNYLPLTMKNH